MEINHKYQFENITTATYNGDLPKYISGLLETISYEAL